MPRLGLHNPVHGTPKVTSTFGKAATSTPSSTSTSLGAFERTLQTRPSRPPLPRLCRPVPVGALAQARRPLRPLQRSPLSFTSRRNWRRYKRRVTR